MLYRALICLLDRLRLKSGAHIASTPSIDSFLQQVTLPAKDIVAVLQVSVAVSVSSIQSSPTSDKTH